MNIVIDIVIGVGLVSEAETSTTELTFLSSFVIKFPLLYM